MLKKVAIAASLSMLCACEGQSIRNITPSNSQSDKHFNNLYSELPVGTRVYFLDRVKIESGEMQAMVDPTAAQHNSGTITLRNHSKQFSMPSSASRSTMRGAMQVFVMPGDSAPTSVNGSSFRTVLGGVSGHYLSAVEVGRGIDGIQPVRGGGGGEGGDPDPDSGDYPSGETNDSNNGDVTSVSFDDQDGITFEFNNSFDTDSYNYQIEAYGENGAPLFIINGSGSDTGSYGSVYNQTSSWTGNPVWSVQVTLTINGPGNSATTGNGHAKGY